MGRGVAASRLAPREGTGGDGWSGPRLAATGFADGPHVWREAHGGTRSGDESSGTA